MADISARKLRRQLKRQERCLAQGHPPGADPAVRHNLAEAITATKAEIDARVAARAEQHAASKAGRVKRQVDVILARRGRPGTTADETRRALEDVQAWLRPAVDELQAAEAPTARSAQRVHDGATTLVKLLDREDRRLARLLGRQREEEANIKPKAEVAHPEHGTVAACTELFSLQAAIQGSAAEKSANLEARRVAAADLAIARAARDRARAGGGPPA